MEPNWQGCRKASTLWALGACPGPAARKEDPSLSVPGAWAGGGGSAGWGGSFLLGDSSQGSWDPSQTTSQKTAQAPWPPSAADLTLIALDSVHLVGSL